MALLKAHFQSRDLRSQMRKSHWHSMAKSDSAGQKNISLRAVFSLGRKLHLYLPLKI